MTLKVLSLNLWHGGRLMSGILDFLEAQDADIVCLQEVYNGTNHKLEARFRSIELLQERLGYKSYQFTPAILDKFHEGDVMCGNAILAKFSMTAGKTIFLNEPFLERNPYEPETAASVETVPRILQHVLLETPEGDVDVFNIHGVWDLDGDNFSGRRRNMRDAILGAIRDKPNVIMAGDTNAQPTNKAMTDIEKQLKSVFGTELKSTFNMRHKDNPGYATARVDMIFTSPNIEVLQKTCHDVNVSDHLPVSATLRIS